jgi:hypothetical protein
MVILPVDYLACDVRNNSRRAQAYLFEKTGTPVGTQGGRSYGIRTARPLSKIFVRPFVEYKLWDGKVMLDKPTASPVQLPLPY